MPRQQVEMKSGSKTNNTSEIGDNNNKQHVSNQNEASQQQQQRNKRSRQQQQQQLQSQHIYENLPVSTTSQQLRKYFRREAIYENLCRGCGYGVFAAQGRYCHFCQCIVSGSVAAALQQQELPLPLPAPAQGSECNIYENICELCRGIYSDSEQCECASSTTPTAMPTATEQLQSTAASTPPAQAEAQAQAAGKAVGKSRTLLSYSRSSAATLTRLFGSLKQLNRSGSLQRRLFQRDAKPGSNAGSGGSSAGSGGSLEIIHNVDEVFRTQETFDMQRICELKQQRQRQLQCSRSDQHIYGRLRAEPAELQQVPATASAAETNTEAEPEPDTQMELELELEVEGEPHRDAGAQSRKKPRVSRMRLLQQPVQAAQSALYLNESICQWMNALRRELHCYDDVNGGVGCQQPKSVPPAYEQERDREREREREREAELVTLRRCVSAEAAEDTETATTPALELQQQAVNEFKRKLLAKREQQQQREPQQQLELSDRSRRRCGINERHDAAFVTEFLSGLSAVAATTTTATTTTTAITIGTTITTTTTAGTTTIVAAAAQRISLGQMWQSAAIAASLNVSVVCYFGYEKLLSAFLHGQRRQRLRLRSSDSDSGSHSHIERWLRRYRRLCESNNNNAECESAARWQRLRLRPRQRQLLGPPLLELAVVPATPASDDVALARRVGSDSEATATAAAAVEAAAAAEAESESGSGSGRETRSVCGSESSSDSDSGGAAMAAPKQSGDAERSSCDDSENNKNNSNNNNNINSSSNNNNKERSNVNCEQQQQQQQQQTAQDRVIKVRRPAPQVPMRNPSTALSKPRNGNILGSTNSNNDNNSDNDNDNSKLQSAPKKVDMGKLTEEKQQLQQEEDGEGVGEGEGDGDGERDGDGEESIYQTIWQFRTREPVPDDADEDFEIITAAESLSDDEADDAEDDDDGDDDEDDADADGADTAEAETLALQAAAAFAAGARHRLTKQTVTTATAAATPAVTPLPSPTASMDHGAWETDDEFMFEKADAAQHAEGELQREQAETLSVGSTVTNSTATLGSISSAGSGSSSGSSSGSVSVQGATSNSAASPPPLLQHPLLRNICIIYSLEEPQKHRAIFYEYQRAQLYQRFMTRIRRPAPPPPTAAVQSAKSAPAPTATATPNNDDSGCSCEAEGEDMSEQIPQPLREEWVLALLASAASSKRGGVAAAGAAGRKTRVRSNARLEPMSPSVLAWRKQLQHVNCCEDEEDMIVPVTDILRAQQIQEDNEVQQSQQTTILQRYKSASSGNLVDIPGEDDKKSIRNRMRMKLNSNVFRLNRSPKSEKKSRSRRSQANSLCLDEQSKYPLFGARLNALELNMSDHPYVPRFVVDVCSIIEQPDAIEQDGLYRASGNKVLVDELKRKLTHLYDPRLLQTDDIHTLTSLHKQFFRELPAPLITQEAYERLGRSLTDDAAIERMRVAFDEMPDPNRYTLRFLIKHLTNVAAASASNRMPASNLAIVWGPCLLAANEINFDIGRMNMIAKVLIENYERIFRPTNERLVC